MSHVGRLAPGFLRDLEDLPVRIEPLCWDRGFGRVLDLARTHGLSTSDACYLELAERMGLPLATIDSELRRAPKKAGVALVTAA